MAEQNLCLFPLYEKDGVSLSRYLFELVVNERAIMRGESCGWWVAGCLPCLHRHKNNYYKVVAGI